MGNWRRRSSARSRCAGRPPPVPQLSGFCPDSVPSWEKKFCYLVGRVPWWKVVEAKNFMLGHINVLDWNDSAGEEAFNNAKNRFWAQINGLPYDNCLPDPDIYIDEVDWSTYVDPDLISDLDQEFVAPDEGENGAQKLTTIALSGHGLEEHCENTETGDNPWECSHFPEHGGLKDEAGGWGKWDSSTNEQKILKGNSPWECCCLQDNEAIKGQKKWGDDQGKSCGQNWTSQSNIMDKDHNPWECSCPGGASINGDGWGNFKDDSRGLKGWKSSINKSRCLDNGGNRWECSIVHNDGGLKNSGWKYCGENSWGGKPWGNNNSNKPRNLESRTGGDWGAWNGGCRKREGSYQYTPRYKGVRFQGDDQQMGNKWRKGRAN